LTGRSTKAPAVTGSGVPSTRQAAARPIAPYMTS
jgi:hypothetical protein